MRAPDDGKALYYQASGSRRISVTRDRAPIPDCPVWFVTVDGIWSGFGTFSEAIEFAFGQN